MKRLIQISDTHVVVPPNLVSDRLNTAHQLERVVERIKDVVAKTGPVAGLLATGDLTDDGSAESFALFRKLIEPLALPLLAIPGNHDCREPMRASFADSGWMPEAGPLNWTHDFAGLRVIGLDTLVEGEGGGELDKMTLDFLDDALDDAPAGPALVALHHPPFASGLPFMDTISLSNPKALSEVLRRSQRDIHLVCGHLHTVMMTTFGGASAISAPSICSTFDLDFRGSAPAGFMDEGGGFLLHDWTDGFHSYVVPLSAGNGPYPF